MKKVVVGIDVGGTNTEVGIVLMSGEIVARATMSTQKYGADFNAYISDLQSLIESLVSMDDDLQLMGIGIGAPNGNSREGTIEQAPNLQWIGVTPFCRILKTRFPNIPINLTNDANAAAMGEVMFGAARGYSDFVSITLGTGLGSGIISGGKLIDGHDGFAGEIGHTIVYPGGRECGCGRFGCIETYLSASGIVRTAFELMVKYKASTILSNFSFSTMTSKDVFDAAIQGDWLAREVFAKSGEILGLKLADIVATLSPRAFFVVGGVARAGDLLLKPTRESMERNLLSIYKNKVKVLPSGLPGMDVAILGAAALVMSQRVE
ncbi:MAG: ROK family protein [Salinivirgaceae bacterium]|nr:ROK family protein [Salinivirgaceae bacterium]MDY0279913.1 ROK family protein [Salinivirgaceae bacterium]